jgi:predicted transcriptional regulator
MARITIDIPDELLERLQGEARAGGQTFDEWASDAIARHVEALEAFDAFVGEGSADADAGRVIPVEDAFAEARAIIENARRRAG